MKQDLGGGQGMCRVEGQEWTLTSLISPCESIDRGEGLSVLAEIRNPRYGVRI